MCRSSYAHRALGKYFQNLNLDNSIVIHEFSNHGAFLKYLKKVFKNVSTSEYFDNIKSGTYVNGIQCQDVQDLSFTENSIDIFTSTEVFEHVPDDIIGFKEIYRCLKPGGAFIFTVPLDINNHETIVRAKIVDGNIVHILDPEYHGDHLREKGILSFRTYGRDIIDKLKLLGFSNAKITEVYEPNLAMDKPLPIIHCIK
jgi:SAM-dependent methyltransferase